VNFVEFRQSYDGYQKKFVILESLNILFLLLSLFITDWILNYKFWDYGYRVTSYLSVYGQPQPKDQPLHNPMCEVFPTEISCIINTGADTGGYDQRNFLCILTNNLLNQRYFFVLWLWWAFLLLFSLLGLVFRLATICVPAFARIVVRTRTVCARSELERADLQSGECFVLLKLLDNTERNPREVKQMLEEIGRQLRRAKLNKGFPTPGLVQASLEDGLKPSAPDQRLLLDTPNNKIKKKPKLQASQNFVICETSTSPQLVYAS